MEKKMSKSRERSTTGPFILCVLLSLSMIIYSAMYQKEPQPKLPVLPSYLQNANIGEAVAYNLDYQEIWNFHATLENDVSTVIYGLPNQRVYYLHIGTSQYVNWSVSPNGLDVRIRPIQDSPGWYIVNVNKNQNDWPIMVFYK